MLQKNCKLFCTKQKYEKTQKSACEFALDNAGTWKHTIDIIQHRPRRQYLTQGLPTTVPCACTKTVIALAGSMTGRVAVKHGQRNRNRSFLLGSSLRQIFPVYFAK
jgi:hypothetical protein